MVGSKLLAALTHFFSSTALIPLISICCGAWGGAASKDIGGGGCQGLGHHTPRVITLEGLVIVHLCIQYKTVGPGAPTSPSQWTLYI